MYVYKKLYNINNYSYLYCIVLTYRSIISTYRYTADTAITCTVYILLIETLQVKNDHYVTGDEDNDLDINNVQVTSSHAIVAKRISADVLLRYSN